MKKKNVLLVIRKGQPELDWITPVLFKLQNRINLYIFFSSEKIKIRIEKNQNFQILKKISKKIFFLDYYYNVVWRLFFKLIRITKKNNLFFLNNFFYKKIHNINKLKNKLEIREKIDIIFAEYGNDSSWLKAFSEFKEKPIIFNYPSSPLAFFQREGIEYYKRKLICDYVFLISRNDFNYWSKSIDKSKMLSIGNPGYDKWWLNKIYNNNKIFSKDNKKRILFAYNSDFGLIPKDKEKLIEKDLDLFMKSFTSSKNFKDTKLIFKIHPFRNNPRYLRILNKYDKKYWEIRNESLTILSKYVDVIISSFDSSAFLDGLYSKKPSIEFFRSYYNQTTFPKTSLHQMIKISVNMNRKNIVMLLKKALFKPNDKIWLNQRDKFNKIYYNRSDSTDKACKLILNLKKNIKIN